LLPLACLCMAVLARADQAPILNLYNWAEYVPDRLIEGFEAEYGIRVFYNTYENDTMLDAKLLAGHTGYDLVGIADPGLQRFLPIGVFMPLDRKKLPNFVNLDPEFLKRLAFSDPGNRHAIPYFWGNTGIAYNVDLIHERMPDAPVDSAAMIFEPEVIRHFEDCGVAFLDDAGTVIRMAMVYQGYDINDTSAEAFGAAEQLLRSVRPYVRYFDSNRVAIDLPAGEVCLTMAWNGDYAYGLKRAVEEGLEINIAYTVPREGTNVWMDTWAILADAPNPEPAYLFLDYLMRPEVMATVSNDQRYPNAVLASRPFLVPEVTDDPAVSPPPDVLARMYQRVDYDLKANRQVNRIWARVKAGF
jgi:putrescine transport system substrate-binding protein